MPPSDKNNAHQTIDFNSVWPYIPIVGLYAVVVIFSLGYAASIAVSSSSYDKEVSPLTAIMLLSGVSLFMGVGLFLPSIRLAWIRFWMIATSEDSHGDLASLADEHTDVEIPSGTLDILPVGFMFIGWLVYGSLLRNYPTFDDWISQTLFGVWLLWLCLVQLDAVRKISHLRKSITFSLYALMLFLPATFGISSRTPWYLLLTKATLTYVLFVLFSVEAATFWMSPVTLKKARTNPLLAKKHRYMSSVEYRAGQSVWVLLCPVVFLFAVVPLGVVVVYHVYVNTRTTGDTTIRKDDTPKPKKKRKKRRSRKQIGASSEKTMFTDDESARLVDAEAIDRSQLQVGGLYDINGKVQYWTGNEFIVLQIGRTYQLPSGTFTWDGSDFVGVLPAITSS